MDKKELRLEMKSRLAAIDPSERERMSADICGRLADICGNLPGLTLLSYMPAGNEVDVTAFNDSFRELGNTVAFPVCQDDGNTVFYAPSRDGNFITDRYGILEPDPATSQPVAAEQADFIIVPCVAFTRELERLGHGGGYYDRYLAGCPAALKILVAFSVQEAGSIETETHDISVDIAVTEEEVYGIE